MDARDFQALARDGRRVRPTDLVKGGLYVVRLNDTAVAGWVAGRFQRWRLYYGPFPSTTDPRRVARHLRARRPIGIEFDAATISFCDGVGSAVEIYEVKRP